MSFGETVRRLRLARGMTLEEVGQATEDNMSAGSVSSVERGKHDNPTDRMLRRFARAFNMTVAQLRQEAGLEIQANEAQDSEFLHVMRELEADLSPEAQAALIATAEQMRRRDARPGQGQTATANGAADRARG